MRQEIIEALCKTIAPTTPTDPVERGRVASLLMAFGNKEPPSINAAELARLVDMRLRQRKDRDGLKPEKIVEEIEATLDLVEMCEFMLESRRRQSRQTTSAMFNAALEKPPTEKESQIKTAIEKEKYPLDFTTGLRRMGVPGDSSAQLLANFWEFFKHSYSMRRFMESGADAMGWEHFQQLPEEELREAFEREKKTKWPNAHLLWSIAQNWLSWHQRNVVKKRETAGKASGAARRAKTKRNK